MARGTKHSSALLNFLIRTATDPDRLARFLDNPDAALRQAKLSPADRRRVLSRKASMISASFRSLQLDLCPILIAWIVTPIPIPGGPAPAPRGRSTRSSKARTSRPRAKGTRSRRR